MSCCLGLPAVALARTACERSRARSAAYTEGILMQTMERLDGRAPKASGGFAALGMMQKEPPAVQEMKL